MRAAASEERRRGAEPGVLMVIVAAVCWGTTGTTQAFAPPDATPLSVGAARLVVGGALLLLYAAGQGNLRALRTLPLWPTVGAAVAMAAYQLTFFAGVRLAGVATGTLVGIGSAPIVAGLLVWMVQGRAPGRRWMVATALAVAGASLIALSGGSGAQGSSMPAGLLLAVGAGASYAVYSLFSARLVAAAPPDLVAGATFGLGALLLLPVFFLTNSRWLLTPRGVAVALMLGLVATALAYLLYTRALRVVAVNTAVTLTLAEPVTASLLGVLLLGERLAWAGWAGVALILAGLLTLTLARP